MNKKDAKIEKYLNAYVKENKPDKNSALSLARQQMQKNKQESANKSAVAKTANTKRRFAIICASACAVVILIASVMGSFLIGGKNNDLAPSAPKSVIYTAGQLSVQNTTISDLQKLNIKIAYADDAVTQSYKLYKLKSDKQPILVQSNYRFISGGVYEDVTLYTELKDGYIYEQNKKFESLNMYDSQNQVRAESGYLDGEYVTNALIKKDYIYCLSVVSPKLFYTDKYIDLFFKK